MPSRANVGCLNSKQDNVLSKYQLQCTNNFDTVPTMKKQSSLPLIPKRIINDPKYKYLSAHLTPRLAVG